LSIPAHGCNEVDHGRGTRRSMLRLLCNAQAQRSLTRSEQSVLSRPIDEDVLERQASKGWKDVYTGNGEARLEKAKMTLITPALLILRLRETFALAFHPGSK
jgi:hypothetical protein